MTEGVGKLRGLGQIHPALLLCHHHTVGTHCEHCQDLYQDHPWCAAEPGQPHTCQSRCYALSAWPYLPWPAHSIFTFLVLP